MVWDMASVIFEVISLCVSVYVLGIFPGCFSSSTPRKRTFNFDASKIAGPKSLATCHQIITHLRNSSFLSHQQIVQDKRKHPRKKKHLKRDNSVPERWIFVSSPCSCLGNGRESSFYHENMVLYAWEGEREPRKPSLNKYYTSRRSI